jgi:hypothetical protein
MKAENGTEMTYHKCTKECFGGKFVNERGECANNCLSNCSKCMDGTTCEMCMPVFFLDDSDSTHK